MSFSPLRSLGTVAIALTAVLGSAASADAASRWGSIPGVETEDHVSCDEPCTVAQTRYANQSLDQLVSGAGVVTGWRVDGVGGKVRLRVLGGPGATAWVALPAAGTQAAQLAIGSGQVVGVDVADGASVPFYRPVWETDSDVLRVWEPALPEGAGSNGGVDVLGYAAMELDVEADADRDGLGDETQDPDGGRPPKEDDGRGTPLPPPGPPTPPKPETPKTSTVPRTPLAPDKTTPAKKPGPAVPSSGPKVKLPTTATATKKGVVTVTLTNPYGQPLTGRITAKLGRRSAGSAAVKLAADAQKQVTFKLSKAARTALKRKRKVSLQVSVKLSGPKGRARTTRTKVVAKIGKAAAPGKQQPGTQTPPPAQEPGTQTPPSDGKPVGFDGTYRASDGHTMVVEGGKVTSFTGPLTLYCTKSSKQKSTTFMMAADDPDPTIAADGTFSWEATTNYGYEKLKFDGKIEGNTASGKLMVEDRSPLAGGDKIEFDYCFAGKDWTLSK